MSRPQPSEAPAADRLALTERTPPAAFTSWLGALRAAHWPDGRFLTPIAHLRAGLQALFDECETPLDAPAQWWIDDIVALGAQFVAVSGQDVVDVRLERVSGDACWRFHVDNAPIRLVTTYFGPGTELVPDAHREDARQRQRAYDGPLRRLNAGDVAVFRGGAAGVVHRSPQIANADIARSVLCLNIRSTTSPELWLPDDETA